MDNWKSATITVQTYKPRGKWYAGSTSRLKPEHIEMFGFQLEELIRKNDQSVQEYSGVVNGFDEQFLHTIEVDYGDDGDGKNFCHFMLRNKVDW